MLKPLEQYICDACGGVIETISDGMVVWHRSQTSGECDFRIVHHRQCDLDRQHFGSSMHLDHMLGQEGLAHLLSMLSVGPLKAEPGSDLKPPANMTEFVDLVRRLQVPHYEEARTKFHVRAVQEEYADANEVFPYLPATLKRICEDHSSDE